MVIGLSSRQVRKLSQVSITAEWYLSGKQPMETSYAIADDDVSANH